MKVAIKNLDNKQVGELSLSESVFGLEVRKDLLHRMVNWQLSKRRSGTHKTKGVSEISGTGKKPFAQKGTGRARAGSLRNPQHRGGAVIFGPVVRSHGFSLPKAIRKLALKTALSAKCAEGKLIVLSEASANTHKTKDMAQKLDSLGLQNALFVDEAFDTNFERAVRNIPLMDVLLQQGLNVYDILKHDVLVLTKAAVEKLEARLK